MTEVYGEIEGDSIVISLPGANDWELSDAAGLLHTMTPLVHTTPEGAISVPLSWVSVTQLSHLFAGQRSWAGAPEPLRWTPGPALAAWIIEEVMRRACQGDLLGDKPKRPPMAHQAAGALAIGMNGRFLLADEPGSGKGHPHGTGILTPTGFRPVEDLVPGDFVIGSDGSPTEVTGTYRRGSLPVYRVRFNDGYSVCVDRAHLWNARTHNNTERGKGFEVMATADLAALLHRRWEIPQVSAPVQFPATALPVDPYVLGVLLGDGSLRKDGVTLNTGDDLTVKEVESRLPAAHFMYTSDGENFRISTGNTGRRVANQVLLALRELGLTGKLSADKFIPESYLYAPESDRLDLLRGLMDTDGELSIRAGKTVTGFSSVSEALADQVVFLVESFGGVARKSIKLAPRYRHKGEVRTGQPSYRLNISIPVNPFLTREGWRPNPHYKPKRVIRSIEPEGSAEVTCLRVAASDSLYLTEHCIVTHNTTSVLMGIAEMAKRNRDPWPVAVVCPASVVDTWLEEIDIVYPMWRARAYRGPKRKSCLGSADMYIMSYETMRNDVGDSKTPGALMTAGIRTLVFDESHKLCLRYDTLIETIDGTKEVCAVREGDLVRGVDHRTGQQVWTAVRAVSRSVLRPTVKLGNLELTPDHPVWVTDQSPPRVWYASSHEDIYLRALRSLLPARALPEPAGTEVLFSSMRAEGKNSAGEDSQPPSSYMPVRNILPGSSKPAPEVLLEGVCFPVHDSSEDSSNAGRYQPRTTASKHGEGQHFTGRQGVSELVAESLQGAAGRGNQAEVPFRTAGEWVADADGRQWHGSYYPAGDVAEAAWLGVHPRALRESREARAGVPDLLQGGPGMRAAEASDRAGRADAQGTQAASQGRQEAGEASFTWLDRDAVPEYGSPERSLWNLSTGTGNYVAAGVLVHNCNYKSTQSVRARRLAKHTPNVVCATGTPITKNVGNFWPVLNSMFPESYPSRDRYTGRYCLMRSQNDAGYGEAEIAGLDPLREPEFRIVMQGTMRRVAKADVLDLPPKTYSTRWIDIPAAHRPAYDEMAEDMLAHLPDVETPLTAMSTLSQMMRLSQLAHSACDCELYTELDTKEGSDTFGEEIEKLKVTMKEPCWKADALLEILDELHQGGYEQGAHPVVAFAPLKQLVMLAGSLAERKGYKVGYIVGGLTDKQRTATRLSFQANELDLLGVTTAAGGVGLTLTAAQTAVFLARPWSFVEATQAEDRIHRPGQQGNAQIIDLVTRNSIEAKIRAALRGKAANLSDLVQDRRIVESFLGGKS